jgi:hypothetical protein
LHLRDEPQAIAGEREQQKNREPHGAGLAQKRKHLVYKSWPSRGMIWQPSACA